MKKSAKQEKRSQNSSGKDSLKHALKVAAVVATLGASLGINLGDTLAASESNQMKHPVEATESNQMKHPAGSTEDKATIKADFMKFDGNLLANGDRLLIIHGKPFIRTKSGKQVAAKDQTYKMQDKTQLIIKGGKIVDAIAP